MLVTAARLRAIVAGLAIALSLLPAPAAAQPPADPACLPLIAGTTGLLVAGDLIPVPGSGQLSRFGKPADPAVAARLPDRVVFRSARQTFSRDFAFVLRAGDIYARRAAAGRGLRAEPWYRLDLPACLAGRVKELSADDGLLIALGDDRQMYSLGLGTGDLSPGRWTWRWGPYLWTGSGMRMPGDVTHWATSDFNSDETFTDTSGRRQHAIGVATVYLLRGDGRRITYLDPWLPNDESREVCGPARGTTPLAGLSGSGSVVFAVSRQARLYTRLYDFDVSGANTVFGSYSWQRPRPASDTRWQLPGPGWTRQPRPPGAISDVVTIATTGPDVRDRVLRVEGRDREGRNGYWEKPIDRRGGGAWRFTKTKGALRGTILEPRRTARRVAPDDRRYEGAIGDASASVADFNPECSPSTLRVRIGAATPFKLKLHSYDGLRQETRPHGLDDTPREYNGAIEVPRRTWRSRDAQDPEVAAWIQGNLGGSRFAAAPIAVTDTRMRFLAQCWELTLNGRPARPDRPRIPPDLGVTVGRLTEQLADERSPAQC